MPTDPKRLQVRDRIVAILTAITAGADYFFTTVKVFKIDILEVQCPGYPCYSVHPDSGGQLAENSDNSLDETFYLNVKGMVKDMADPRAAVVKASRDVRQAIDDDFCSGGAGSLGALAIRIRFPEPPATDNGLFSGGGLGFFELRVEILITGDYGSM